MSLVILAVVNPPLIFAANTPTGGDMGAHVLAPAYLRDVLLPSGRILGWSMAWFAGFPAFYFYFPLPSLVIVLLDLVLPYGVAFKLVAVLGLLATPPAAYYLARCLRLSSSIAVVAAAAGAAFVFMESFSIYGGNIASTMAGEFSFSWSFAFSLVYLGLLMRAVQDDRRYSKWAALVLALTALCHILTTIMIMTASLVVLTWKGAWRRALPIWAWGFAISGFWSLPLLLRIGYSSDMAWSPLRAWDKLFPLEIWLALPVAVAGAVWAVRRTQRAVPVLTLSLIPLIYYPLPLFLPDLMPSLFPESDWKLWNGRLLPYWYFGVMFFAALGLGAFAMWAGRRLPGQVSRLWPRVLAGLGGIAAVLATSQDRLPSWAPWLAGAVFAIGIGLSFLWTGLVDGRRVLAVGAAGLLGLGSLAGLNFVQGWARWNFEGYEGKQTFPEYQDLMVTLAGLPPGRVLWEQDSTPEGLQKYGTPMSPMLIPYWTEGTHTSMEGLFFESSITTPFHFITAGEMSAQPSNAIPRLRYRNFDFDRGLAHLQLYGVDYYVSYTESAAERATDHSDFELVAQSGPFNIFRLPPTSLVEPLRFQPAVYDPPGNGLFGGSGGDETTSPTFERLALDWFDDLEMLGRPITDKGPVGWPRIDSLEELPQIALADAPSVTDLEVTDHRVSFRTSAVGIPHLVKVSYFPNWTARGAQGPYRSTPSLMIVVPTEEEVVLEFSRDWGEWLGIVLTLLGVAALVVSFRSARSAG
jgi:hypothetical protein